MVQSIPPDMIRLVLEHTDECKITLDQLPENPNAYTMIFKSDDCQFSIYLYVSKNITREICQKIDRWDKFLLKAFPAFEGDHEKVLYSFSSELGIIFASNNFYVKHLECVIKLPKRYNKKIQEFIDTSILPLKKSIFPINDPIGGGRWGEVVDSDEDEAAVWV